MKENRMNKLIELFKQYKRETWTYYEYILFRDNDAWLQARCIDDWKEIYIIRQAEILSKKMGFIKRLIDNKKIDLEEVEKINQTWNIYIRFWWDYEKVLMILAISDNPVEFLISILK